MKSSENYDVIIAGTGMGGMSVGAMLSSDGYKVLLLEAAHVPGGCSSSYTRKGYTFESGATTLIGFDEHQPLRRLEDKTGIRIPRKEINPGMTVRLKGQEIIRYKNREKWIREAGRVFGNPGAQRRFWELAFRISDLVWRVSVKNTFFPPQNAADWIKLLTRNSPLDVWALAYAFRSVKEVMAAYHVDHPDFIRFCDEQLMITAQSESGEVPFIFGAAGLNYTNYSNFYVPGGLLEMVNTIRSYIESNGGALHTKEAVVQIKKREEGYEVVTSRNKRYTSPVVVSNIPVWNMAGITEGELRSYFNKESGKYNRAWGAITLGIATEDTYPDNLTLHHQIHLDEGKHIPHTDSDSFFVSMSERGDRERAGNRERTLNISTHAGPEHWFNLNGTYEQAKSDVQAFILDQLREKLPGFKEAQILTVHTATPVTWQNWVYRKKGRVGGIPQSMARSLLDWTSPKTPFKGLYLVGDTTYPGQGIPGVTLSGINVYSRIRKSI